jgi:hypothetical protein
VAMGILAASFGMLGPAPAQASPVAGTTVTAAAHHAVSPDRMAQRSDRCGWWGNDCCWNGCWNGCWNCGGCWNGWCGGFDHFHHGDFDHFHHGDFDHFHHGDFGHGDFGHGDFGHGHHGYGR